MKRLIPLFLICFLFSFSVSAFQPNEIELCCNITQVADSSPTNCLTKADLIGGNWIEQVDKEVAATQRVFTFNKSGHLDISTVFDGGYVEAELTTWTLFHYNGYSYLSIDDPVLGELITYEVKATKKGIQLKEKGFEETLEFHYVEGVEKAF